jgi:lipoprotein-releasing system ATP-binding protein
MILLKNIEKSYGKLKVLKGINFQIENNQLVTIVGASGAGKSTLLHIMGTIDRPDKGEVIINGQSVFAMSDSQLSKFRNQSIGFVFQFHYLLPEFTAVENIAMPALIAGVSKKTAFQKAEELLDFMQLTGRKTHKPSQLSGGEQQRIAVARALINQPEIILADEPSGNLDSDNALKLHQLFLDLKQNFHQSFVIVTHNQDLANKADKQLFMKDGLMES